MLKSMLHTALLCTWTEGQGHGDTPRGRLRKLQLSIMELGHSGSRLLYSLQLSASHFSWSPRPASENGCSTLLRLLGSPKGRSFCSVPVLLSHYNLHDMAGLGPGIIWPPPCSCPQAASGPRTSPNPLSLPSGPRASCNSAVLCGRRAISAGPISSARHSLCLRLLAHPPGFQTFRALGRGTLWGLRVAFSGGELAK